VAKIVKGPSDADLLQVQERLERYERDHPGSDAALYRQNNASIRVRIIDDRVAGMSRSSRHREAWQYVQDLPEDVQQQITVLLLLPTAELGGSLMNLEFDDPLPSAL
jgi:hypothetical protein